VLSANHPLVVGVTSSKVNSAARSGTAYLGDLLPGWLAGHISELLDAGVHVRSIAAAAAAVVVVTDRGLVD